MLRVDLLFETPNCGFDFSSDSVVSQSWAERDRAPKRYLDTSATGTPVMYRIDIEGPSQVYGDDRHSKMQSHEADSPFEFL